MTRPHSEVVVAYTRYGDADLSGTVNLSDFNKLASNFGQSGKVWADGRFQLRHDRQSC
jgi:hypothetical protein